MKIKVVYFTRSGACKRLAEKIAGRLSCDIAQIDDHKNWQGFFGYWKAGFYASAKREVPIDIKGNLQGADELVVVTPLWAGGIAPATQTFLKTIPAGSVHLVVSSDGSRVKDRAGFRSVSDIPKNSADEDEVIDQLVKMMASTGPRG